MASPLTADDVKWSLGRACDPKAGAWSSSLASIDGIEASGGTVKIALKHPDPTIILALATFNAAILPQKLFEAVPGATPEDKALPFLDELEFPIIPDDATRPLKLKAREIDGTEFVPYARVKELQADPSLRMELWPSTRITCLTMFAGDAYKDGKPNPWRTRRCARR